MMKEKYIVVSFSGGKDSTAMLLRMLENGNKIDEVVRCDTGKEFPAMYRHIDKVKSLVESKGIKFTTLKSEKSFDYYMFEHKPKRRNPNLIGNVGLSWAGSRARWCTSKLKTDIFTKYFSSLKKQYRVIRCIGIAADEGYRLKRAHNQSENHRHPLIEWGWDERQCLEYCYSQGFDWDGLYKHFKRVSCWCCPLTPLSELRILRKHFPDLWEELRNMDNRTWRKFKADYSVEELDKRFAFEEERLKNGLPITTKDFFCELKERLKDDE